MANAVEHGAWQSEWHIDAVQPVGFGHDRLLRVPSAAQGRTCPDTQGLPCIVVKHTVHKHRKAVHIGSSHWGNQMALKP